MGLKDLEWESWREREDPWNQVSSQRGLSLSTTVSGISNLVCDFVVTWSRLGAWSWLMGVIYLIGHLGLG